VARECCGVVCERAWWAHIVPCPFLVCVPLHSQTVLAPRRRSTVGAAAQAWTPVVGAIDASQPASERALTSCVAHFAPFPPEGGHSHEGVRSTLWTTPGAKRAYAHVCKAVSQDLSMLAKRSVNVGACSWLQSQLGGKVHVLLCSPRAQQGWYGMMNDFSCLTETVLQSEPVPNGPGFKHSFSDDSACAGHGAQPMPQSAFLQKASHVCFAFSVFPFGRERCDPTKSPKL